MLYYNFKNYDEFKELFGIVEHGNGVKSRKNKILLAMYKDKATFKKYVAGLSADTLRKEVSHAQARAYGVACRKAQKNLRRWNTISMVLTERYGTIPCELLRYYSLFKQKSLPTLKTALMSTLTNGNYKKDGCYDLLRLNGNTYFSDTYCTDDMEGLCEDGTLNAIRYVRTSDDRVFKMKAGKMFNHIMSCNTIVSEMPEQIKRWLSEEWVAEWVEYARENIGETEYTLHVDDNFEDIYDPHCCAGYDTDCNSFGSCMVGDEQWSFYRDAVDAKAAYLKDNDDKIVARCIVFTNVHEFGSDKIWRLAERQYSRFCEPALQRQLVMALIRGGHIDGYKAVGASCGDARRFLDIDGNSIENKDFWIPCELEDGDTLSYQDSFKWFDYDEQRADNCNYGNIELDTTSSSVSINNHEDDCWSEYHEEWIDQYNASYVETRGDYFYDNEVRYANVMRRNGLYVREDCFEDDCIEIGDDYYYAGKNAECPHEYGIYECPECGEYFVAGEGDSVYSELTEEDYCCDDCREEADRRWHEDNGEAYSDYDESWFDKDEVILAKTWGGRFYYDESISIESFNTLVESGMATEYCGKYYVDDVLYDGEPRRLHYTRIVA